MRVLSECGSIVGEPYVKHIEGVDGLYQLRPQRDRFFFVYEEMNSYIIIHHFVKSTQKTPQREIETAIRIIKERNSKKMKTWDDIEKILPLNDEENEIINLKVQLISKLVQLRQEKKITQEQFAKLCGVKQSFIARIESDNTRSMTLETLIKLAHAIGYKVTLEPIGA